ncbi:MAG: hypothetical protein JNM80_01645 [Phycisphaerae bacterium]|nr:hypothetical protein [Phycisphaerae bacterium]
MTEIQRVLKRAGWRLLVLDLMRTLAVTLTAAVVALMGVLVAERIFGLGVRWPGEWLRLWAIAAGLAIVAALGWSVARRARGVALAREVDERADLRESLSTAMCVERSEDAWARLVVETARERARRVDVRRAIPMVPPRLWPVPLGAVLVLAILWFSIPTLDVLGLLRQREAEAAREREIVEVKAEVKRNDEKLQELMKQARVDLKEEAKGEGEAGDPKTPQTPEEIRRSEIKKLTSLQDRLKEMKGGEKAQEAQAIKQAMKQLKQPGPGPLDELTKSLQRGDFGKAQQDLEELSKRLATNSMTPEDKAKAQEQLKRLSEQLEKLAQDRQDLEKKLEQAGLGKEQASKLARDPEALKKALEAMKNLSEEQKQQLTKAVQAQMKAGRKCEGMSDEMGKMARNMGKNGLNQDGSEAMQGLSGQLSEMEMLDKEMEALDAASKEAGKQLARLAGQCAGTGQGGELQMSDIRGQWKEGETQDKFGGGSGGPGVSGGGRSPDEVDSAVSIEKKMSQSKNTGGPIVGSRLVYGDQVRGESVREFSQVVEAGSKAATEAVETMQVRRELHGVVKHYFGRLEARARDQKQTPKPEGKSDGK